MHRMRILNSKEVKEIRKLIEEQWGHCPDLSEYAFLSSQKNRLYIVTREIANLPEKKMRIDTLGMYFGELMPKGGLRLGMEGAQMIGTVATDNLIELTEDQVETWLTGKDIDLGNTNMHGFVILKHKKDILGCGHIKEGVIGNYVPKNRRLNEVNPTFEE